MAIESLGKITEVVDKYVAKILEKDARIIEVYLYGSFVKGINNETSDIDIAIVLDGLKIDVFEEQLKYMKYRRSIDMRIEPHIFMRSELEDNLLWQSTKDDLVKVA